MSNEPKIFTLKQVVSSIRKTIEERYHQTYWVKAEMHKLNRFPSGHCFPELLQKEDGKIVAQISGSIWKHNFERINQRFMQVVKEPLKDDTTLLMQVKIAFHETYGLSLQILDIDPNYALGELQRERQETLKRLQKEGLLNANQQLKFPLLPQRIAVISAESSKGLSDFYKVIDQNQWNYAFFKMLFPAYVQGDNAVSSIVHQLRQIEKVKDHFDVVVIVRGGGGEVGLSCYNNYDLCAAIASFSLPVLTGIGHSTNLTVAEMISFRNAITPTELGDFLIQSFHEFSVPLKDAGKSIKRQSISILSEANHRFNRTFEKFSTVSRRRLQEEHYLVRKKQQELIHLAKLSLKTESLNLQRMERMGINAFQTSLKRRDFELKSIQERIPIHVKASLVSEENKLAQLVRSVELMDPIKVLKRGYSITTLNKKTIGADNRPAIGEKVITRTATFTVESEITEVKDQSDE
ncbi:MAG: exodeoxyribonuclease VII large subunit [Crocinitomicaceae bacterium]|nr:exodeoxyribonuclease VII large subunit [Crocinitomicaceae bacterium]